MTINTMNSAALTAAAARKDLELLSSLIPWETLTEEERFVMEEGLQRIHTIMTINEEKMNKR